MKQESWINKFLHSNKSDWNWNEIENIDRHAYEKIYK